MSIEEILELQKELDLKITMNSFGVSAGDAKHYQEALLAKRLLALHVEVSELANATKCFKYWSTKPSEPQEIILDEFADVLHFVFSVANSLNLTAKEIEDAYLKKHEENYKRQQEGY